MITIINVFWVSLPLPLRMGMILFYVNNVHAGHMRAVGDSVSFLFVLYIKWIIKVKQTRYQTYIIHIARI